MMVHASVYPFSEIHQKSPCLAFRLRFDGPLASRTGDGDLVYSRKRSLFTVQDSRVSPTVPATRPDLRQPSLLLLFSVLRNAPSILISS